LFRRRDTCFYFFEVSPFTSPVNQPAPDGRDNDDELMMVMVLL
jgi:hypothetical protein